MRRIVHHKIAPASGKHSPARGTDSRGSFPQDGAPITGTSGAARKISQNPNVDAFSPPPAGPAPVGAGLAKPHIAATTRRKKTRGMKMAKVMKSTDSSSLAEVVDRILDKGIVIDAWAKVSLVGIELLSVEARVVIASVETYLKYAEAIGLTATAAAPTA